MSPVISPQVRQTTPEDRDEINLMELYFALIERKWWIVMCTFLFAFIAVVYVRYVTPIYQATAMIQVEDGGGASIPGLDEMGSMFGQKSKSTTEIELMKSRAVISEVVDDLQLDIVVQPKLFPIVGARSYRTFIAKKEGDMAEPSFGADSYAWGGESIDVFRFDVPDSAVGDRFVLRAGKDQELSLFDADGALILSGKVGQELEAAGFALTVRAMNVRDGVEFYISRNDHLQTILTLQRDLMVSEKGKDTGILTLSMDSADGKYVEQVLDKVAEIYVRNNVERSSAEAQKSLDFLKSQLPDVKRQLEEAEGRYNDFQIQRKSVNITLETQGVLELEVDLESKLQELELKRLELSQKFKPEHPLYQSILQQIRSVKSEKGGLVGKVKNLPETQQTLLRLKRDVEVGNEIYTMLLGKAQELNIVRAGTVGNVRVIDVAQVNRAVPVKPKKSLIVLVAALAGFMLSVLGVLVYKFLNKGVEDPAEIEAIGLPVYASVPYSQQADIWVQKKQNKVLAVENPADLSIEALRSLRTSLHFALIEAKNNVIAMSGPSPGVGKSFVSTNLAAVLAQGGKRVLLVDADLRKGHIKKELSIKENDGLSDVLSGRVPLESVIRPTVVESLDVIIRGTVPPNPSELLMHARFKELLDVVQAQYDYVIVDTPPILAVTDPAIVSAYAGVTLLVTRFGQNHIREIELTRQRFEQNGVEVKGVVFNGVKRKGNGYGYGYSYGYYNYEYKSDKV